ncbi:MAG: multidrug effflux MFS transporter [Acidimicrobiia bacterium]
MPPPEVTATAAGRTRRTTAAGRPEFLAIIAMAMALAALGIDAMLPAFDEIRASFGLAPDSTQVAGLITTYFFGLAVGQLVFGPLSDRVGRRPMLWAGFALYGVGALAAALSPALGFALVARFVWGLGASGPRAVAMAIIRDSYEGEQMSRAYSLVMAMFILVPVVGPTIGAAVVAVSSWRVLFVACAVAVAALLAWSLRLPETLPPHRRRPAGPRDLVAVARVIAGQRATLGYTLALTAIFGAFSSYLASSEAIFDQAFGRRDAFPLLFGGLAATMGLAMVTNAKAVMAFGTARLSRLVLVVYVGFGVVFVAVSFSRGGHPPLPLFLVALAGLLCCFAFLTPNLNTLAMAPLGHVAGSAASVLGAVQTAVGAAVGTVLDRAFDGTPRALAVGFLASGVLAWAAIRLLVSEPVPGPTDERAPSASPA